MKVKLFEQDFFELWEVESELALESLVNKSIQRPGKILKNNVDFTNEKSFSFKDEIVAFR